VVSACTTVQSPDRNDVVLVRATLTKVETGGPPPRRWQEPGVVYTIGWCDTLHFTVTDVLIGHTDQREIVFPFIEEDHRLAGHDYYLLATRSGYLLEAGNGKTLRPRWTGSVDYGLCMGSETIEEFSISREVAELSKTIPCR